MITRRKLNWHIMKWWILLIGAVVLIAFVAVIFKELQICPEKMKFDPKAKACVVKAVAGVDRPCPVCTNVTTNPVCMLFGWYDVRLYNSSCLADLDACLFPFLEYEQISMSFCKPGDVWS